MSGPLRPVSDRAATALPSRPGPASALLSARSEATLMAPLLEVRQLVKEFTRREGFLTKPSVVRAVNNVSFEVDEGETFGLVGESGCGKTTTGRCILRLIEPTSGRVLFRGQDVLAFSGEEMRQARRNMQIVFQDPYSSLNPRMRARQIIEEPLIIHKMGDRDERNARVVDLYRLVGLDPATIDRYPHEFSGGQRQRIGVARALALNPSLIIADEPVSALDVSIQAQVVNLLIELQEKLRLTYLFIAHDLRLVEHICRRTAVMYLGRIVEMADTSRLFNNPQHAYTKALLSAIPVPDPDHKPARIELNAKDMNLDAPLREIAPGHFAAV
jgi:ABC-type oligopeptide transport system ATPase subunit